MAQEKIPTEKIEKAVYAFFSVFVVGLGQILKGNNKRGLKFLLFFYFAIPALIFYSFNTNITIFLGTLGIGIIALFVLWMYNIVDAYKN